MHCPERPTWALVAMVATLCVGCATPEGDPAAVRDVYMAPETALGSNLPRRGERRSSEAKEVKGDALESLKGGVAPGPMKGTGN